jgi:hypothetical protein
MADNSKPVDHQGILIQEEFLDIAANISAANNRVFFSYSGESHSILTNLNTAQKSELYAAAIESQYGVSQTEYKRNTLAYQRLEQLYPMIVSIVEDHKVYRKYDYLKDLYSYHLKTDYTFNEKANSLDAQQREQVLRHLYYHERECYPIVDVILQNKLSPVVVHDPSYLVSFSDIEAVLSITENSDSVSCLINLDNLEVHLSPKKRSSDIFKSPKDLTYYEGQACLAYVHAKELQESYDVDIVKLHSYVSWLREDYSQLPELPRAVTRKYNEMTSRFTYTISKKCALLGNNAPEILEASSQDLRQEFLMYLYYKERGCVNICDAITSQHGREAFRKYSIGTDTFVPQVSPYDLYSYDTDYEVAFKILAECWATPYVPGNRNNIAVNLSIAAHVLRTNFRVDGAAFLASLHPTIDLGDFSKRFDIIESYLDKWEMQDIKEYVLPLS